MNCPRWDRSGRKEKKEGKVKNSRRPRRTKAKKQRRRAEAHWGCKSEGGRTRKPSRLRQASHACGWVRPVLDVGSH
jgi:hypothetical protein